MSEEIENHKIVAHKLVQIKDEVFSFIRDNLGKITEYDVQRFILKRYEEELIIIDKDAPIVAINKNTSFIHYFPKKNSEIITKDSLILIDLWGGLKDKKSFFGDITWMAYSGKSIPKEIQEAFDRVICARDVSIEFIKKSLKNKILPKCSEVDKVARESLGESAKYFAHNLGHSIGFDNCHGKDFILGKSCDKKLELNIPFTIEPGIYFENKFGVRSEIDCYVDNNYELIIASSIQDKIILL
ncbi:MAG: M24 family metallopeptidase [Nanoarchaeota archaeon]